MASKTIKKPIKKEPVKLITPIPIIKPLPKKIEIVCEITKVKYDLNWFYLRSKILSITKFFTNIYKKKGDVKNA